MATSIHIIVFCEANEAFFLKKTNTSVLLLYFAALHH